MSLTILRMELKILILTVSNYSLSWEWGHLARLHFLTEASQPRTCLQHVHIIDDGFVHPGHIIQQNTSFSGIISWKVWEMLPSGMIVLSWSSVLISWISSLPTLFAIVTFSIKLIVFVFICLWKSNTWNPYKYSVLFEKSLIKEILKRTLLKTDMIDWRYFFKHFLWMHCPLFLECLLPPISMYLLQMPLKKPCYCFDVAIIFHYLDVLHLNVITGEEDRLLKYLKTWFLSLI